MADPEHSFARSRQGVLSKQPSTDPTDYEINNLIPKLPTTPTGVRLMLTLAGFGYNGQEILGSVGTLAAAAGICERSVQRLVPDFNRKGWLTVIYKSRGLADTSGQPTNKYRLNWDKIRRDAQETYEGNLQDHRKRQAQRAKAFNLTRLGQPPQDDPSQHPKGDKKGDKPSQKRLSKGDRMSANLVFLLEEASREGELENEGNKPVPEGRDLAPCRWDSEFTGNTGIEFETSAGTIFITGDMAERWVGWEQIDGAQQLGSARQYLDQRGLLAPDKIALVCFLAEYTRKVALGYEGHRLDGVLEPFKSLFRHAGRDIRPPAC